MIMRQGNFLLAAALVVSVCGVAACGKKAVPEGRPASPQSVGVVTLHPQRVEIVTELPGRTSPFRVAEVRPQVSGIILKRLFEEGGAVREGQQLYQIDPARYQAAADNAQAAVARAEAIAELAGLLATRREKLATSSVISRQDRDDAAAALKEANANVLAAKAALETARINLEFTRVMSPISGSIGRSFVTEGALVTEGQPTALAVVYQLDPIYVDITQSSTEMLRLRGSLQKGEFAKSGEAATRLILEDGTTYQHTGQLQFSEVNVDQGTGSVTLRAVFPNPDHVLLPGMFVRALVTEGVNEQGLLAPQQGVTHNAKGQATARVVNTQNTVEARVLEVDRVLGDQWLIKSGLQAGDRVIVEGLQKAPPGAVVAPSEVVAAESGEPGRNTSSKGE